MDPKVKKLLDKIRSNINIPLQRESVVESTGAKQTKIETTEERIDINPTKRKYEITSYDFDKDPTQQEFDIYRESLEKDLYQPSLRKQLALRFRPFYMSEGESKSDTIFDVNAGAKGNELLLSRFPEERKKRLIDLFNENLSFDTTYNYEDQRYNVGIGAYAQIRDYPRGQIPTISKKDMFTVNRNFPVTSTTMFNIPNTSKENTYIEKRTFNDFLFEEMLNNALGTPVENRNVGIGTIATYRGKSGISVEQEKLKDYDDFLSTVLHEKVHAIHSGFGGAYYDKTTYNLTDIGYDSMLSALLAKTKPGKFTDYHELDEYVNRFPEGGALYEEALFTSGLEVSDSLRKPLSEYLPHSVRNTRQFALNQGVSKHYYDYIKENPDQMSYFSKKEYDKNPEAFENKLDSILFNRMNLYNKIR